ncbi:hypothetical protein BS78_02G219600 [Paspalum vaginatum]|nr:hypothetical protein BS78_02G219600 [Paspalum vaginatum]
MLTFSAPSMARILASGAGASASSALGSSSWLLGLCVFVVSVWVVSFAVFICGRSSHGDYDSRRKKHPTKVRPAATTTASHGAVKSPAGTVADSTSISTAAGSGGGSSIAPGDLGLVYGVSGGLAYGVSTSISYSYPSYSYYY